MDSTITFTFGDAGENHVGNQVIGNKLSFGQGFDTDDLRKIKSHLESDDIQCELYDINNLINTTTDDASLLVIRQFIPTDIANKLYHEHISLNWDNKYYCTRRSKVLNKHARHNLMYNDIGQIANYENKMGTIISWENVPILESVKHKIENLHTKCNNLICEGNHYYDNKTGIGWHGDTERTKVIAVRVGKPINLCYRWWFKNKSQGNTLEIMLNHGDAYIMSEKCVGNDWKKSSLWTLRHSAGAPKYTKINK